MTTFTNANACLAPPYDLETVLRILEDDGLVLLPTDALWSVGCDAANPLSLTRLTRLVGAPTAGGFEILVDSVPMLKDYVTELHPRLETLLYHHVRPLAILLESAPSLPKDLRRPDGLTAFRLAQDDYCRSLIARYRRPLATAFAHVNGKDVPSNFGAISSTIIEGVDHVVRHRQLEKKAGGLPVMVSLSEKEELIFWRE